MVELPAETSQSRVAGESPGRARRVAGLRRVCEPFSTPVSSSAARRLDVFVPGQESPVTRRIVATVVFLCLAASMAEAVVAQVRTARAHASDRAAPPAEVVLDGNVDRDGSVTIRADEPDDRRAHRHHDDREHDPAEEHCAHHHVVGPTADEWRDVTVGVTSDLSLPSPDTSPSDRAIPPSPEPPRA